MIDVLNSLIGGDDLDRHHDARDVGARYDVYAAHRQHRGDAHATLWGRKAGSARRIWSRRSTTPATTADHHRWCVDGARRWSRGGARVRTLDALEDLIVHLRGLREERKAVITLTDGWPLYGPRRISRKPLMTPTQDEHRNRRTCSSDSEDRARSRYWSHRRPRDPNVGTMITNDGIEDRRPRRSARTIALMLSELSHENRFIDDDAGREPRERVVLSGRPGARCSRVQHSLDSNRALEMMIVDHRWAEDQRDGALRIGPPPHRRRSQQLLPARVLLAGESGRQLSQDHRSREAPRRQGACASRISRREGGRDRQADNSDQLCRDG